MRIFPVVARPLHAWQESADSLQRMPKRIVTSALKLLRRWVNPAYEMAELATKAQAGTLSVEEMIHARAARGQLRPLVKAIANILLDLKQQRAELAAIEQEIRDRVANRTDALERKIGSLTVQATRDALTSLGNRRGLDLDLPRLLDHHRQNKSDACLLMIDVDHFKPLNDTLGHAAGDQLLREIGQLIRSTLRGQDQAYRSGGDEFVVILHGCDRVAGQSIATRLESLVRGLTQSLKVAFPPQLSIGVCAISELPEQSPEALLKTADARLYAVKATRPRIRRSA